MSSKHAPDARWSLTRRLAIIFALTNCCILFAFSAAMATEVMETLRHDVKNFIEHELTELELEIREGDGLDDSLQVAVNVVGRATGEPDCGLRVRRLDGTVLASGGSERMLQAAPSPIKPGSSWRRQLFSDEIATGARRLGNRDMVLEIVVDASNTARVIYEFILTAIVTFLGAALLSFGAGWFVAHRGLRGLREVVRTAAAIRSPSDAEPIQLDGAPDEIRAVGEALNTLLARIDEAFGLMRSFTAGLAHELRSPLQNLIGETEVTLLAERDRAEYRDVLRSNLDDLYDLTDAVDNLVTFCRTSEPDPPDLRAEEFDLAEEATLRLARERRVAERLGLTLELICEGNATLSADRESVLRVLRNLVGNAMVWTPGGGVVRVSVIGSAKSVSIAVDDAGPGVSPDLGDRIFEPFVSGRGRRGQRGNYGLGLAICRSVMEEHGGRIWTEPSVLGGARFVAEFPRAAAG